MGEAKRRAERRREARAASQPEPFYSPVVPRLRQCVVNFLPDVYDVVERERAAVNERLGGHILSFEGYVNGVLARACEAERQIREEEAQSAHLVQGATGAQVQQVLSKMAPAVPRPAA